MTVKDLAEILARTPPETLVVREGEGILASAMTAGLVEVIPVMKGFPRGVQFRVPINSKDKEDTPRQHVFVVK